MGVTLTETPLHRGPPWTETLTGQRSPEQRPPDRDPLDRDPVDRDPWTETPFTEIPLDPHTVKSRWYASYWILWADMIHSRPLSLPDQYNFPRLQPDLESVLECYQLRSHLYYYYYRPQKKFGAR